MTKTLSNAAAAVLLAVGAIGCGGAGGGSDVGGDVCRKADSCAGGSAAGGTGGSAVGGTGGSPVGGRGGSGGASGGTTGTGGTATGGSTGSGGAAAPVLITSAQNAYWVTGQVTKLTSGTADLNVDKNTTYQRWDGFGGCFNEAGWDALSVLPADQTTAAMKLLFDSTAGANFAYGRLPMGDS